MGRGGSPNHVLQAQRCGANKNVLHITTSLCVSLPETTWEGLERSGDCRPLLAAVTVPSAHCIMSWYGILMENHDNSSPPFKTTSCAGTSVPVLFVLGFFFFFFLEEGANQTHWDVPGSSCGPAPAGVFAACSVPQPLQGSAPQLPTWTDFKDN